jgi:spermidine synthase
MLLSCLLFARISSPVAASFQDRVPALVAGILAPQALPHLCAGLFVALLFSTARAGVGRLYFWNLLGSAAGCLALVLLLAPLGGERVVLLAALLAASGAVLLAGGARRRLLLAAGALGLLEACAFLGAEALLPFRPDPIDTIGFDLRAAREAGRPEPAREYSRWDVVGRVEVWRDPGAVVRVPEPLDFRVLAVDSGGTTQLLRDGGREGWGRELFEETVYGVAYAVRPRPERVLVIGCGGGMDVQAALHHGAGHVTAVEINAATIDAVRGPYAGFLGWPRRTDRVTLRHDDGRAFVKATAERFDVIQMTGVDTITVYATGSINMNEDSLYTVDAFADYLRVLRPDGVLAVLRVGADYVRLTAIATEALLRLGVRDPGAHVVAFRQHAASGVLVKRRPFTGPELDRFQRLAARRTRNGVAIPHFDLYRLDVAEPIVAIYLPERRAGPVFSRYFELARARPGDLGAYHEANGIDVPTDDDPYYMLQQLLKAQDHPGKFREAYGLMRTFWWSVVALAAALILLPVAVLRRRAPSWRPMSWLLPYFFGIGFLFMVVEICVVHLCAIFAGSPGASLAVVLTGMLVASGAGAYVSEPACRSASRRVPLAAALALAGGLLLLLGARPIFDAVWGTGAGQAARAVVIGLLIAPLAFALGWFFPAGLRLLREDLSAPELIPWAVSVNGFASVLGSIVVLPASMAWGFRLVFGAAIAGYLLVGVVTLVRLGRARAPR